MSDTGPIELVDDVEVAFSPDLLWCYRAARACSDVTLAVLKIAPSTKWKIESGGMLLILMNLFSF